MGTACCCLPRRSDDCLHSVVPFCSDDIKNPCQNLLFCMCCFIMYLGVRCRTKYRDCKTCCCCCTVEEEEITKHKSSLTSNRSTKSGLLLLSFSPKVESPALLKGNSFCFFLIFFLTKSRLIKKCGELIIKGLIKRGEFLLELFLK